MELSIVVKNRRSIRKYKDINIPNEIIEDLIDFARLAPSAKNRQPWKFVIVKDKTKNEIANIMSEKEEKSKVDLKTKIYNANSSVEATANIMRQAPILILVFRPKEDNWIIGDSLSIGAAIEHVCLRATDLGLGSLWIRDIVYTKKEITDLVGKSDMELISAISIGYPDENPNQRSRKKINEILEWYEDEK